MAAARPRDFPCKYADSREFRAHPAPHGPLNMLGREATLEAVANRGNACRRHSAMAMAGRATPPA
jgi:hypothetical protein